MRTLPRLSCLATVLLVAASATAVETVMRTESWGNNDRDFATCNKRIASMRGRNLLSREGVKVVDSAGLGYGTAKMLFDGSAGVRLGDGRVGLNGKPAVLTFYLGGPKVLSQIGVFTFNSDARTNQDFEVRFVNNESSPGKKPTFPEPPSLTTGPTIVGKNTGGFHAYFRAVGAGGLSPDRADWVQFRFWPTYNQKAGAPAKDATKADSWTSLVELEVLGDDNDVIWIPDDDFAQRQAIVQQAAARDYAKRDTWQETLVAACEKVEQALMAPGPDSQFVPHLTDVLRGGQEAVHIDLPLVGLERVWLETDTGSDGGNADWAVWGEPVLIDANGNTTPLTSLKPLYTNAAGDGISIDKDRQGKPLQIGKRTFTRGLLAAAPTRICYALDKKHVRLQAWVGLASPAGAKGSSRFKVLSLPSASDAIEVAWPSVERDFRDATARREMAWEREDRIWDRPWQRGDRKELAARYAAASHRHPAMQAQVRELAANLDDTGDLTEIRDAYHRTRRFQEATAKAEAIPWRALRLAIEDLVETFGDRYEKGDAYLAQLNDAEKALRTAMEGTTKVSEAEIARIEQLATEAADLQHNALLANPLLAFDDLLLVRRKPNRLGMPANWQSNSSLPKTGYDNDIARMSISAPDSELQTVFRPDKGEFVGDVDLQFDADRMLFSMPSSGGGGPWHIYEIGVNGKDLRQITQTTESCINNYDACYLPDGRIVFTSTAGMVAVPCVRGSAPVATLFRMNADGSDMRQLCFDQEHSWHPSVMHDGRILYTRWEYADLPHSNSRMLFTTNPDGTNQRALYGSGSFWPNSIFYARAIPDHRTRVVATITGHHAPARMGELLIFDPAVGTREAEGAVQRIPGYEKKVEPIIQDGLTGGSWPKFLHPYPLSEKYFLVSARPSSRHNWGIYLVDVFDNIVLVKEEPGYALLEPVPLRKTVRPPVVPDRVDTERRDAIVLISDIHTGPGLKGVPRGEVKKLRLYTYTFGYQGVGGLYGSIGMDGPWDMRRTLGTVPVEPDGSAMFRVPANTPIALQPLDSEGKALQIMRSWLTAMPGETLSCIGCHEGVGDVPPPTMGIAARKTPSEITPWRGPFRNYEFKREVQPVLDRHCVGCHNGTERSDARKIADLRGTVDITDWSTRMAGNTGKGSGGKFSVAYANLHRFVRRPGIESPMPMQTPLEFHADTTELVQMLNKGHHGVKLDADAWDRIITWIDFNAPYHGRWSTIVGSGPANEKEDLRARLRKLYANVDEDHEALPEPTAQAVVPPVVPASPAQPAPKPVTVANWPFGASAAKELQQTGAKQQKTAPGRATDDPAVRIIDLADGLAVELVYVPAGEFAMGSTDGYADEVPMGATPIKTGFWMSRHEITNAQFRLFDPTHDSGQEDRHGYQFGIPGYDVNQPTMPAVRLSWRRAIAFCKWLSERHGHNVTLPSEAQWEWACRAGTGTPFAHGDLDTDFAEFANMGDAMLADFSGNPYVVDHAKARYGNPDNPYDNWVPQDARFNDGGFVSGTVGKYKPNAWGLHDMHGNAAEWTLSQYLPYPYRADDGRNAPADDAVTKRVIRGGSWYDRPKRCTSSYRYGYRDYQCVYNVGFRIIIPAG